MQDETSQSYVSLLTGKDVPANMIVKDTDLRECPIKEVLRWVRVRNLLVMRKIASESTVPKIQPLKEILTKARHF